MREMGNWREYFIERLASDREAAIDYLQLTLEEYQTDGDLPFFLKGLRTFIESQGGVSELSKRTGIDAETLLYILSGEDAPRLDMLRTMLNTFECRLIRKGNSKSKGITLKNLTDEQINMFVWGSESFFATSLFAEEKFNNIFPELDNLYSSSVLAAPKGNLYHAYSLLDVMSSNFGMAFELKLKCIQYFTLNGIFHDHVLENLFNCLPKVTQDSLSRYYREWIAQCLYEKKFIKYVHSENQIVIPSITPIDNFKGLLKFFDEIGLYNRRFAFERFESTEWSYAVLPSAFKGLIKRLDSFIRSFGIKSSPSKSQSFFIPHLIFDTESAENYYEEWGRGGTYQIDPLSGNLDAIEDSFLLARVPANSNVPEMNPIIKQDMRKKKKR